jgi:GNAT superfamily N-acetyltransferase
MSEDQRRGRFVLVADAARMDVDEVHRYLAEESYWSPGIPRALVARSIANSLCFGVFAEGRQISFARVISDRATYAYLCDVYVLEDYRGQGLASWMLDAIDAHPELQGLKRWGLVTRDAHPLYLKHGWVRPPNPDGYLEKRVPDIYRRAAAAEDAR